MECNVSWLKLSRKKSKVIKCEKYRKGKTVLYYKLDETKLDNFNNIPRFRIPKNRKNQIYLADHTTRIFLRYNLFACSLCLPLFHNLFHFSVSFLLFIRKTLLMSGLSERLNVVLSTAPDVLLNLFLLARRFVLTYHGDKRIREMK